jgi:hypothetical protein
MTRSHFMPGVSDGDVMIQTRLKYRFEVRPVQPENSLDVRLDQRPYYELPTRNHTH